MLKKIMPVWKKFKNEKNIIIYQMGKVGSSSLENSIKGSIHTHMFFGNSPCHVHLRQRRSGIKKYSGKIGDAIKVTALKRRKIIKIITPIRDPADRNISMFFQDLAHWIYFHTGKGNHDSRFEGDDYLKTVFKESFDHEYALNWFDIEFRRLTGIDIYSYPYDKEKGIATINKGKFSVLVLDSNKIEDNIPLIEEFAQQKITLKNTNTAERKWYGDIYKKFKSEFDIEHYREKLKTHKFYKKFY